MNYLYAALCSYLLGSIPTALAVVYLFSGRDVRSGGSGNMGAMNTMRMLKKYKGTAIAAAGFLIVWIADMAKAVAAYFVAQIFLGPSQGALAVATGFAILGHNYPVFLRFKGGRGAASFMGVLLYFSWQAFLFWILTIFAGMILFELIELSMRGGKLSLKGIFHAISEQILGRLAGEIAAVYAIYVIRPDLLIMACIGTALIIISHHKRLTDQLVRLKKMQT